MAAAHHRVGFCLSAAVLAVLLFIFSSPYVMWMLMILLGSAAASWLFLRHDARGFEIKAEVSPGGQAGRPVKLCMTTVKKGMFMGAAYAVAEIEISNIMFGTSELKRVRIPLLSRTNSLEMPFETSLCGETGISCISIELWDVLGLFRVRCAPFKEARTTIYPVAADVQLSISRETSGTVSADGMTQNRKGTDHSEIFDIREYVPGDDIRGVHWKLSCKTDSLIMRQPSDPAHYDVMLLPDIGLGAGEEPVSNKELEGAASFTLALAEELLSLGTSFCLAIPGADGLDICEVRSRRQLEEVLPRWLGTRVTEKSGVGLRYFISEHMEQYFTRLLLVSGGKYVQDMRGLDVRMGITIITAEDGVSSPSYTAVSPGCDAVVLPADGTDGRPYRIVC